MKFRIQTNGKQYKIQHRVLWLWYDTAIWGSTNHIKIWEPEYPHSSHKQEFSTIQEALDFVKSRDQEFWTTVDMSDPERIQYYQEAIEELQKGLS